MPSEPTSDLLAASYEALNEEIRSNSTIVANVIVVTATGSATLVGFGVQLEQPGVFLAAFLLLIPTLTFVSSQADSTARIASYIAVNYESQASSVCWENDLRALRVLRAPKQRRGLIHSYSLSFAGLYALIGVTCVGLAFYFVDPDDTSAVVTLSLFAALGLTLLAVAAIHLFNVSSDDNKDRYFEQWTTVRDERLASSGAE